MFESVLRSAGAASAGLLMAALTPSLAFAGPCQGVCPPTIPSAQYIVSVSINGNEKYSGVPAALQTSKCIHSAGCAVSKASALSNLSVSASATSPSSAFSIDSNAQLNYFYEVFDPFAFAGQTATVHITGDAGGSSTGTVSGGSIIDYMPQSLDQGKWTSGHLDTTFSVPLNTPQQIIIAAFGDTGSIGGGRPTPAAGSFSFWADPTLSLTAADLAQFPGAQILFSPNIMVPVPEPGTWALLLTGVGLAGAALRRRNRYAAA